MGKLFLKIMAMCMVMMMLVSLVACGGNNASSNEPSSDVSNNGETAEPTEPEEEAPVTLKYWTAVGSKGTSGVHDNPI
ncbi:MAG: hypothetical protein GX094_08260, partial [Clostridiales bacterium]|nr:hypothetical protein [Clostridiales bacterium]